MNLSFKVKKDDNIQRKVKSKKNTRGIEERDAFREAEAESEPPAELEDAIDQQKL
jgi:hypothetical protein